ncbi:hypothetical protein Hanom_Chr01g00086571 [Helianthus anomalus]
MAARISFVPLYVTTLINFDHFKNSISHNKRALEDAIIRIGFFTLSSNDDTKDTTFTSRSCNIPLIE